MWEGTNDTTTEAVYCTDPRRRHKGVCDGTRSRFSRERVFPWRGLARGLITPLQMKSTCAALTCFRANGRGAPANLSPRGQAVVTSLASRFLILPICRAERLPGHGSRRGCGGGGWGDHVSPLGERCVSGAGRRRGR